MGKNWNPKRQNKERFGKKNYKDSVKRHELINSAGDKIKAANQIVNSDPTEAIRILKPLVEVGNNIAIDITIKAYFLLNDLIGMERLIKTLKLSGVSTIKWELELMRQYFQTGNLDKIRNIYEKSKGKIILEDRHKMILTRYFIEIKDFKSAREMYFQISLDKSDALYGILNNYLETALSKPEYFPEAMAFVLELHEKGRLKGNNLKQVFKALYNAKEYVLMTRIYSFLEESDKTIFITFDYLNALRKLRRYPVVINYVDSLLKIYSKENNRVIWGELSTIKAFCLSAQYKERVAQRLFKEIIAESGPNDFYFDWALCGYIYTQPKLDPIEVEAYKTYLTGRKSAVAAESLRKDITDALTALDKIVFSP